MEGTTVQQRDQQRRAMSRKRLVALVKDVSLTNSIEAALFASTTKKTTSEQEKSCDFQEYARVLKQIVANLRLNTDLLLRLQSHNLSPDLFVSMKPDEMATQERKRKREEERRIS